MSEAKEFFARYANEHVGLFDREVPTARWFPRRGKEMTKEHITQVRLVGDGSLDARMVHVTLCGRVPPEARSTGRRVMPRPNMPSWVELRDGVMCRVCMEQWALRDERRAARWGPPFIERPFGLVNVMP